MLHRTGHKQRWWIYSQYNLRWRSKTCGYNVSPSVSVYRICPPVARVYMTKLVSGVIFIVDLSYIVTFWPKSQKTTPGFSAVLFEKTWLLESSDWLRCFFIHFVNSLPSDDHCRVILSEEETPGSDYINANFIDVSNNQQPGCCCSCIFAGRPPVTDRRITHGITVCSSSN